MYDINMVDFYRCICPRYSHYCESCEFEFFDMKEQIWVCPYDRFGDVLRQISVLETEPLHSEVKNE